MLQLPSYDRSQSYAWNYANAPDISRVELIEQLAAAGVVSGQAARHTTEAPATTWTFCGRPIASPLGISAGPLLNGRWLLYYAALGYDVLTYKTVRSRARDCYALPNLVPVASHSLRHSNESLAVSATMEDSWAISFGMPSQPPQTWQQDLEWTKERLPQGKLLSVSVVASPQSDWQLEQVAQDYARCARWAVECGADAVELNFSCPNVASCDGQLYQHPQSAAIVAECVRQSTPGTPLLIKIGALSAVEDIDALLLCLQPHVDALSMTNCIAAHVADEAGPLFAGETRGIGGAAIFEHSVQQVALFSQRISHLGSPLKIIGVGGICSAPRAQAYLQAGAECVQLATAAMLDPLLATHMHNALAPAARTKKEQP